MVLKIVGYAEQVVQYYQLEDFKAYVWIAHQRYPTKGRVWHPGGAHPFVGLNEALVHNGDFANYYSVTEYLRQRNIYPLFLTDTEVSVLLFDFWQRVYGYPLEYIIEALAPTTELDFDRLPPEKQKIYQALQTTHIHGSPDGPWFFIIGRYLPEEKKYQLIGITDTAMLRPQVFALQEGKVQIGLICSEKQAIDAALQSLAGEDSRFCPVADRYWNARGGSYTDGGAFVFTLDKKERKLTCTNKFGQKVSTNPQQKHCDLRVEISVSFDPALEEKIGEFFAQGTAFELFAYLKTSLGRWGFYTFRAALGIIASFAQKGNQETQLAIEALTLLNDRYFDPGQKKRSSLLHLTRQALEQIFAGVNNLLRPRYRHLAKKNRKDLSPPTGEEKILIVDGQDFAIEGEESLARFLVSAYELGWRQFIVYRLRGHRFIGCGFGPRTRGVRLDIYGSAGDYLGSGIDGMEIYLHNNGQDQLAQIIKAGKLVVFGDVGQTFMYGAKGGEVYVLGNAAGRALINAVGRPRVVINGVALDYLAESFMAGDSLKNGGFVILNGLKFDDQGHLKSQSTPYPGSNLFSLASGGAIYLRDPKKQIVQEQLNGGTFTSLTQADWELILPYLQENERLFGISVENFLLKVDGQKKSPFEVYRKVKPVKLKVLTEEEAEEG
jgi:glutamate synthase domain-containing protein 3